MIFSEAKWNGGAEIKRFVNVSAALSWKKMENPLYTAFHTYIVPVVGEKMAEKIVTLYNGEYSDIDAKLIEICQFANANLAFWNDFDALSLRITDAGFQRQESENGTFKPAFKYQEDNLRRGFKNKGFNHLDGIIDFLFAHVDEYPEFKESETYKIQTSSIVKNTAEVNDVYYINNSRLVYLRLSAHFRYAEEMELAPAIGDSMYDKLVSWLKGELPEEDGAKMERLRIACSHFIVSKAVKKLLQETGSITDRGLYFSSVEASGEGNQNFKPVDMDRLQVQIQNVENDATVYLSALTRLIRNNFSEFYVGDPAEVYNRDNNGKKTFWA